MRVRIGRTGFGGTAVVVGALLSASAGFAQEPKTAPAPAAAAPAVAPKADAKAEKAAKAAAKKAFGAGKKLFDAGKYVEAIEEFKKADASLPGFGPRLHLAESYDKLGRTVEAIAAYKAFLELNPTGKEFGAKAQSAKDRIGALEATLPATLTVRLVPSDARNAVVTIDGKAPGADGTIAAGEHAIEVKAEGFEPFAEKRTLKGGEKVEVVASLVAVPPPAPVVVAPPPAPVAPPPAVEPEQPSKVPAFVTLGIAGAGAALGTTFGILAMRAENTFNDNPTEDNAQKAERNALIADMSFGVALTFGITGAVLLFSNGDEATDKAAVTRPVLAPFAGRSGGGMAATWRF